MSRRFWSWSANPTTCRFVSSRRVRRSVTSRMIFALAPMEGAPADPVRVEMLAVSALEQAIERAVRTAAGRDGVPGLAD